MLTYIKPLGTSLMLCLMCFSTASAFELERVIKITAQADDTYAVSNSDAQGNLVLCGNFKGAIDFHSDPTLNFAASGLTNNDLFLVKYDQTGDLLWSNRIIGRSTETVRDIAFNSSGEIFITGYFFDDIRFDPDGLDISFTSTSRSDAFIAKYDSLGQFIEAIHLHGLGDNQLFGIDLDTAENVIVVGRFENSIDVDLDTATSPLTVDTANFFDAIIVSYSKNLDFNWASTIGAYGHQTFREIKIDRFNQINICGTVEGSVAVDFDPGLADHSFQFASGMSSFLVQYDASGRLNWLSTLNNLGALHDWVQIVDLALDPDQNIYLVGKLDSLVRIQSGQDTLVLNTANKSSDILITKFSNTGELNWAISLGGTNEDKVTDVSYLGGSGLYVSVHVTGSVDLNPDTSQFITNGFGQKDIGLLRFDHDGNFLTGHRMGGARDDIAWSNSVTPNGDLWVTGKFTNGTNFSTDTANPVILNTTGTADYFIALYSSIAFSLDFETTFSSCGGASGSIETRGSGRLDGLQYHWAHDSQADSVLTGLAAGTYYLTATNDSGYLFIDSVAISDSCGHVSGYVYEDKNANGQWDSTEAPFPAARLLFDGFQNEDYTDLQGKFNLVIPSLGEQRLIAELPTALGYCDNQIVLPFQFSDPDSGYLDLIVQSGATQYDSILFGIAPPTPPCGTVSGTAYTDLNQNDQRDSLEPVISGLVIRTADGRRVLTNNSGQYEASFLFNESNSLNAVNPSNSSHSCNAMGRIEQTLPSSPYTFQLDSAQQSLGNHDFAFDRLPAGHDAGIYSIRMSNGNRAGRRFTGWMDIKVKGEETDDVIVVLEHDPMIDFVSSTVTPTSTANDAVTWQFPQGSAPSWACLGMTFTLDSAAVAGDELHWRATISDGSLDRCPRNDEMNRRVRVANGPAKMGSDPVFNPSLQAFDNEGMLDDVISVDDSILSYVVNYQNLTDDTVYHMTISCELSAHLNMNSVSLPFSSLPYKLSLNENRLQFNFEQIVLPDSLSKFEASYGFVQFNIKLNPDLAIGTDILSRAVITMNYHAVDSTNLHVLSIGERNDSISGLDFQTDETAYSVFPNPGKEMVTVEFYKSPGLVRSAELIDLNGKRYPLHFDLPDGGFGSTQQQKLVLKLPELSDGSYLLQIVGTELEVQTKLMIHN